MEKEMLERIGQHSSEEVIDAYCLNQLSSAEMERVEVHLLICGACRGRVDEIDELIHCFQALCADVPEGVGDCQGGLGPARARKIAHPPTRCRAETGGLAQVRHESGRD
jgi:anti-sigma factor RsiW